MRTLQEKYNGIQEGKFSKENFLADARRELPNLVTRFNGYDDAVQILKNRGMISEIRKVEVLSEALNKDIKAFGQDLDNKFKAAGFDTLIIMQSASPEQLNIVKTNTKAAIFEVSQNQEAQMLIVRVNPEMISKAESIINKFQLSNYNGPVLGKGWTAKQVKGVINPGDIVKQDANRNHGVWEFYRLAKVDTKVANVNEARLTKNNLTDYRYKPTNEMDKYPYEQILRGIRVELEGMGVQATPTAEEYAKALAKVSKNLGKDSIFYTNQLAGVNTKVDLHDKMVDATAKNTVDTFNGMKKAELKEGFKKLIKKVLSEEVIDVESYKEEVYEMYGEGDVDESAMGDIYQIAKEHDRFEHFVQAVEDEFGPVEDIAELEHIFNSTRGEDGIDFGDENFSDSMIDGEDEADDISHPRGYEEASDEESFEDLFETVSLKDLI